MDPLETLRPLIRTRQYREFTDEPLTEAELHALTEAARWTGSSSNNQPWQFLVVRDPATLQAIHDAGLNQTRLLRTAVAAIVIVLPADNDRAIIDAYDEGRAAERILVGASMLGLGGGIGFIRPDVLPTVREILDLPADRRVRSFVALGHPTEAARQPKSAPGTARKPREAVIFDERLPRG
jgi:nitroreductase